MGEIPTSMPKEVSPEARQTPEERLEHFVPLINQSLVKTKNYLIETDYLKMLANNEPFSSRVFDYRSELYEIAMELASEARNGDLVAMQEFIKPQKGEISADLSAGTGFLTKAVSEWTQATTYGIDPSEGQLKYLRQNCSELVVPVRCWPDNEGLLEVGNIPEEGIDFVTSFGGIHHINNRYNEAFQNVAKMLKPGGRFQAADVPGNSILQCHFDEVVNSKSLTRHPMGRFMTPELLAEYSQQAGLELVSTEIKPLTWDFNSTKEMAYFFKGLHAYDLPEDEIVQDLKDTLGFKEEEDKIKLNWPMLFFDIRKK